MRATRVGTAVGGWHGAGALGAAPSLMHARRALPCPALASPRSSSAEAAFIAAPATPHLLRVAARHAGADAQHLAALRVQPHQPAHPVGAQAKLRDCRRAMSRQAGGWGGEIGKDRVTGAAAASRPYSCPRQFPPSQASTAHLRGLGQQQRLQLGVQCGDSWRRQHHQLPLQPLGGGALAAAGGRRRRLAVGGRRRRAVRAMLPHDAFDPRRKDGGRQACTWGSGDAGMLGQVGTVHGWD